MKSSKKKMNKMLQRFTANGSFIPQDAAGNDMCILFMKYGRCRFKAKCKKSHWVPQLPDDPYPVEIKPPLPDEAMVDTGVNTPGNIKDSSKNNQKVHMESSSQYCQNSIKNIDYKVSFKTPEHTSNCMLPRRFKHVFHDNRDNHVAENVGVSRIFHEAGAYFDNVTQKLQIPEPPKNKLEKHHLKVLRRIHWRTMESLKEKLSQYPPSFNLKFNRSKINFTRLRPYIYILTHECMCCDGEKKAATPSWFEYLVAETLLAYLDHKCVTPQQAEEKLRQWGARPVRARQCIAHLWHILAISSRSPDGCAEDVVGIEEDVFQGNRTSLDYAHACAFALNRVKYQTENTNIGGKSSSSVMRGLQVKRAGKTKVDVLKNAHMFKKRKTFGEENAKNIEKHVTIISKHELEKTKHADDVNDHAQTLNAHAKALALKHAENANELAKQKITDDKIQENIAQKGSVDAKQVLCNLIKKKRKRSRQFKNVPLDERKRIKTQCIQLLSTL